jgi:hypothetical protein
LAGQINCRMIVSAAIAELMPKEGLAPLGRYTLKDIDEPQLVFGVRGVSA